ncbi:hypothetical protein HZC33_02720 [Candidatus Wolfebacteria bacterium]|nr:hypothetical protein [Candidatus Wolfebacteria bacterium]
MKISNFKFKILIFLFFAFYSLFFASSANAQVATVPQFLISWKAQSYAPNWYGGKIFPNRGSRIEVAFELIDNGKIADISKLRVRWYINDKLVLNEKQGLGLKTYSFRVFDFPGQDIEARISVLGYKGGDQLDDLIIIPVVHSEAVIDAPYASRKIGVGNNSFFAYPFFFNISDLSKLSFQWFANSQVSQGDVDRPQKLDLNIDKKVPKDFEINLRLKINNLSDDIDFSDNEMKFKVK